MRGTLVEVTESAIRLSSAPHHDNVVTVPGHRIESLELSTGKRRRLLKTLVATTLGSAVIVGALSAVEWDECRQGCGMLHPGSRSDAFVMGATLGGGGIGLPLGLFFGLVAKYEAWVPVRWPPTGDGAFMMAPALGRDMVRLTLSIPWGWP